MKAPSNGSIILESQIFQAIDEKCVLIAHLSEKGFAWELRIEGEKDDDACDCFSMFVYFTDSTLTDWRELENRNYIVRADDKSLFPLLPSNPSGAYAGIHYSVNNHRARFGKRDGYKFSVSWECDARLSEEDSRSAQIRFIGSVQFDGLILSFDSDFRTILDSLPHDSSDEDIDIAYEKWQPDFRKAGLLIAQHFPATKFDKPLKWRGALRYHVRN